uniref:G_PROTEIN_RECEP_F1_2 domain-containing protein n=1 Tax=Steinernema glaseri TaxID=37863 RepID=A0A1I7ZTY5_9BILA
MRAFLGDVPHHTMSNNPVEMTIFSMLGAAIAVINLPIIALIFTSPALKKCKELVLIGGVCTVDAFLALCNSVSALDRMLRFPKGATSLVPQSECFFKYYVVAFFYANLLVGLMTLLVSLERFFAVFFPLRYKAHYTRRKGVLIMMGGFCSFLYLS